MPASSRYAANPLARLMRHETTAANNAEAEIRKAQRAIRRDILELTNELDVGRSANAREEVVSAVQKRIAQLEKRLTRVENAALEYAAKEAVRDGSEKTGVDVRYSKERADEMIGVLAGKSGKSLAAVFTENMAANVIDALRTATVAAMRENAVAGGTEKELARTLEQKWLGAAKDGETFQFVDAGGHVWDTKTYVAMNVRTNAMRVYNDCLADTIARATGGDLVRVSSGGDPDCRLCFPWEGRILSLTGKTEGFPTYEQAREAGCFHPNCVHTLEYVDELLDADEIELQKAHPVDAEDATPEELDENRYEIDQDRYRRQGMDAEQARLAVDRDNLEASIRAGLLREDARQIVDGMTDAQIRALCKDGNPPSFEPTKKATRDDPHAADEKWSHGSRGGVFHVARDASAEHIIQILEDDESRRALRSATGRTTEEKWEMRARQSAIEAEQEIARHQQAEADANAELFDLPAIQGRHTYEDDLSLVNPNYGRAEGFDNNCQRCIVAFEMRCRGLDVVAKRKPDGKDPYWTPVLAFKDAVVVHPQARSSGEIFDSYTRAILSDNSPVGSRYVIFANWGDSGHVMNAVKGSDVITIYDGQTGKAYAEDKAKAFLSAASPDRLSYFRTDNLELLRDFTSLCVTARSH